jgi:hypothetical protein
VLATLHSNPAERYREDRGVGSLQDNKKTYPGVIKYDGMNLAFNC